MLEITADNIATATKTELEEFASASTPFALAAIAREVGYSGDRSEKVARYFLKRANAHTYRLRARENSAEAEELRAELYLSTLFLGPDAPENAVELLEAIQTPNVATHNGYITVENTKTDNHRTFRILSETWNEGEKDETTNRVVSLLTGPDRTVSRNWKKFAFVKGGEVRVWKKNAESFGSFAKILNDPKRGEELGLVYLFEGKCRKCNRRLSNPESIRTGIGPHCAKKEAANG